MTAFKKIGDVVKDTLKEKDSKLLAEVMKVVNLPPDKRKEWNKQYAIAEQHGSFDSEDNSSIKSYFPDIETKHTKIDNGKGTKPTYESEQIRVVRVLRKNERGETYSFNRNLKRVRVGWGRGKLTYDVKTKDGYEYLKLVESVRDEKIDYNEAGF